MVYDFRGDKDILKRIAKSLNMRFPIATIARDLKFSKGVVSEYYNGKKPISHSFIERFENFYEINFMDFSKQSDPEKMIPLKLNDANHIDDSLLDNQEVLNRIIAFLSDNNDALKKNSIIYSMYIKQIEKEYKNRNDKDDLRGTVTGEV